MATGVQPSSSSELPVGKVYHSKPVVIGLYGISGAGKTFWLDHLKAVPGQQEFYAFYEGAEVISRLVAGGLQVFKQLSDDLKTKYRQQAIVTIQEECRESGKAAIVTGHLMFSNRTEGQEGFVPVYTQNDLDIFTHILYLDIPGEQICSQRQADHRRTRPVRSVEHLDEFRRQEKTLLRRLCYGNDILLTIMPSRALSLQKISWLINDFRQRTEEVNLRIVETTFQDDIRDYCEQNGRTKPLLVVDGDKTMIAEDTGELFWDICSTQHGLGRHALKDLFSSSMGYSYIAFRQAASLYEESGDSESFRLICDEVASRVIIHPEMLTFLRKADAHGARIVILTCGLQRIWKKILRNADVDWPVFGNGRLFDPFDEPSRSFIITPKVKAAVVARCRKSYGLRVCAIGDSPVDLPMFKEANHSLVVVCDEKNRSKSMESALSMAIDEGLHAVQALLPSTVPPRLNHSRLPIVRLNDAFSAQFSPKRYQPDGPLPGFPVQVVHATNKNAARLLMSPMRDARMAGPALAEAHRRVGNYLTLEFLSEFIGVEPYPISHVQGHSTVGYRMHDDRSTAIIALMRAGEPMARGVFELFPRALFLHSYDPQDIKARHITECGTVILVDAVVNTGKSIAEYVRQIRQMSPASRIIVVAGVIQSDAVSAQSLYSRDFSCVPVLSFVALRLSENKFKGQGTTDTGNRLFNTTYLP